MAPKVENKYDFGTIAESFRKQIEKTYNVSDTEVGILSGGLTDLNNDGAYDDFAGNALLKVGGRFKSFIYLLRTDGSMRFLENNGVSFDPNSGLRTLSCNSKPIACPNTMDRARQQIGGASFSVMEYDKSKAGLEVVISLGSGSYSILNSLEVFTNP
ncbi:MAG: hypothetical protein U1F57_06600 [bacterium]